MALTNAKLPEAYLVSSTNSLCVKESLMCCNEMLWYCDGSERLRQMKT